ncbi:polyprenal reductase [Epargyreus clarus]|uniref:polyprenal reductase n=1 Tax=Epargyreus clarus TaxID=520877 RepID=UPI003C2B09B1
MFNIIDIGFLGLAITVAFTGFLINNFEKHVPAFIIKGFRYGSFAYQGNGGNFLQVIEIPKAFYRHFYSFSSLFSSITLIYSTLVYFYGYEVHSYVMIALKLLLEQERPSVSVLASMAALSLLTIQCIKRCYETYCMQVFAKSSKMNLSHYIAGLGHYFAVIVAIIGQAPLFCGDQNRDKIVWADLKTVILLIPGVPIFLWAVYEQYQTNVIFANLRKDKKSGQVVTEEHKIPHGRLFEKISSPHRFCEIILYTVLLSIIPTKTFFCIFLWVLCNQIQTAIQAHGWYNKTFKNYPTDRHAIFQGVL